MLRQVQATRCQKMPRSVLVIILHQKWCGILSRSRPQPLSEKASIYRLMVPASILSLGFAVTEDTSSNPSVGSQSSTTTPGHVQTTQGPGAASKVMTQESVEGMPVVDLQGRPMTDPDRITALRQVARSIIASSPSWAIPAGGSLVFFGYRGGCDVDSQLKGELQSTGDGPATMPGYLYTAEWEGHQGEWSAVVVQGPVFQAELYCKEWGSIAVSRVLPQEAGSNIDARDIIPEAAPTFSREFAFINEAGERVPVPGIIWLQLNGDNHHHGGEIRGNTVRFDYLASGEYHLEGDQTGVRFQRKLLKFVNLRQQGTTWINLEAPTPWTTYTWDAMQRAQAKSLLVLLYFSARTWSRNCIRLDQEVFLHSGVRGLVQGSCDPLPDRPAANRGEALRKSVDRIRGHQLPDRDPLGRGEESSLGAHRIPCRRGGVIDEGGRRDPRGIPRAVMAVPGLGPLLGCSFGGYESMPAGRRTVGAAGLQWRGHP